MTCLLVIGQDLKITGQWVVSILPQERETYNSALASNQVQRGLCFNFHFIIQLPVRSIIEQEAIASHLTSMSKHSVGVCFAFTYMSHVARGLSSFSRLEGVKSLY